MPPFSRRRRHVESACWLLARIFLPGVETDLYQRKLDIWGRQLRRLTESAISTRERVAILTNYLANDLGFRGNSEQYYDVHNSLLPSLIDSKLGIPISLAVLYIAVAGRAGIKIEGINLPGHFIVRHGDVFFDPFHRGKILMQSDCESILRKQKLTFQPSYLEPATGRMILIRVLANLLYIFQDNGDEEQRERISNWLKALERKVGFAPSASGIVTMRSRRVHARKAFVVRQRAIYFIAYELPIRVRARGNSSVSRLKPLPRRCDE